MQTCINLSLHTFLLLLLTLNQSYADKSLYLVQDYNSICSKGPIWCPTRLLRLDTDPAGLIEIQSLQNQRDPVLLIDVFPECSLVLMLRGTGQISYLYTASTAQPTFQLLYEAPPRTTIQDVSIWSSASDGSIVRMQTLDETTRTIQEMYLTLNGKVLPQVASSLHLRLGESYPVAGAGIDKYGHLQFRGRLTGGFPPTPPDSILGADPCGDWSFALTNQYLTVFQSVADRHGLTKKQLLIYVQNQSVWHKLAIPGDDSEVHYWPGWLAGTIAHTNPNTDFTVRRGGAPVPSDSAVFLNLKSMQSMVTVLGQNNEILWIESDTVYYRSDESLYKARIGDSDLVDRQLILTDPRIKYIHWAFSGRVAGE